MNTNYLTSIIFAVVPFFIWTQNLSISGVVTDEKSDAVSYANIVILKASDSTLVTGSISDEKGHYIIENLEPSRYVVKASFLGYKTVYESITLQGITSLNIVLEEDAQSLDEIEITAKKPTLERQSDRLIFNVESTSLTEGNVWDLLKSTPGILMMNDEILVKNSSNIIYTINGRRVYLSDDELQQLFSGSSANAVQAVEVITNPSAKYDAEGGAVINIKMSKNLVAGYNGSIYNNYTQGIYPRNQFGTSHFFKSKNISLFAGYSFDKSKINRISEEDVHFMENGMRIGHWDTDVDRNTTSETHNANLNFDYFINDNHTLSLSGNANVLPYWKRTTKSFTQAIDSTFSSLNSTDDNKVNIAANMDYVYQSDKGSSLSFNLHHTNYEYDRTQDVVTNYRNLSNTIINSNTINTTADQDIKIYSGQVDLALPLKNDGSFELGIKLTDIGSKSDLSQFLINTDNARTFDIKNSGLFDYDENTFAGYINLEKSWQKWDLSLGLRTEYTKATGELKSDEDQINDFDYLEWFPTFNLSHTINENHALGVGYNRRIERPTYANLNPFRYYFNDNSFVEGNPNLNPTITQIATLTYTIKDTYTFEAYYRIVDDGISELTIQDNTNNTVKYLATNIKQNIDFGLDFSTYTALTDNWSIYTIVSGFRDEAEYFDENSNLITKNRWSVYANYINYFSFLKDRSLSADLSLLYISPVIMGPAEVSSRAQVDFGLKKSFNKGKWIVSLRASDIFLTTDFTVTNNYGNQNNRYYSRFDNQWVRLGLRYKFGNTKLQTNENIKELEERDRLKTNQ